MALEADWKGPRHRSGSQRLLDKLLAIPPYPMIGMREIVREGREKASSMYVLIGVY
jgi:hypothetical protein